MDWVRGRRLGAGTSATVYLAANSGDSDLFPPLMAVKSSPLSFSKSLMREREVLHRLDSCPEIIRCFGDSITVEGGVELYNLVLEYASWGSLSDQLAHHGGRLPESLVRRHTRAILKGLDFIHSKGMVHCDVKLGNILVVGNGDAKIADFGLAKMAGEDVWKEGGMVGLRGTPQSIAPESITRNMYESPCDVWALACAVVEMTTGKAAWNVGEDSNICSLIWRIGRGEEVPDIPTDLSDEGKDFLQKCFERDPTKRWSAEMLLNHPFAAEQRPPSKQQVKASPRTPLELLLCAPHSGAEIPAASNTAIGDLAAPAVRVMQLATREADFDWSVEGWVSVRISSRSQAEP